MNHEKANKRFGVLYFLGVNKNIIKDVTIINAKNLEEANKISQRGNMEFNIAFPLNKPNRKNFENLLKYWNK